MTAAAHLVPRPVRRWLRSHGGALGSVVAVRTPEPEFVLTYDDGPQPGGTDEILAVLAERGASATFFVLLTRTRRYRHLLESVVEHGHEIALHGVDHRPISRMSYAEARERTVRAKEELEDMSGRQVKWFRPPYGLQSLTTFRAIRAAGLTPVLWGPTAWDSRVVSDDERVASSRRGAAAGAILLCHDGYAGYEDGGRNNNPPDVDRGQLATRILDGYAERGLRARSLSQVLQSGTAVRGIWFAR